MQYVVIWQNAKLLFNSQFGMNWKHLIQKTYLGEVAMDDQQLQEIGLPPFCCKK